MRAPAFATLALLLFVASPASASPEGTRPLPLHTGDLQAFATSAGTHVLAYAGGPVVAIDAATGSVLWAKVEPGALDGFAAAAGDGQACVGYATGQGGMVACHSLATGDPQWQATTAQAPYRATWAGGLVVGFADGALRKYGPDGAFVWQVDAEAGSAGIHALASGGGRVYAALLHGTTQSDPPLGRDPDDRILVLDAATGQRQGEWSARLPDGSTPSPYSLQWEPAGLVAGLDLGWLVRFAPSGVLSASTQVPHQLAVTSLALTPSGLAAGSLRGALSLHGADLAEVWPAPRATDAGHTIGLAYDADAGTLVSAHRSGVVLAGPLTPSASLLVHAPRAATVWRQTVASEVSVSRQGTAATVPLRLEWLRPDGQSTLAWEGQVEVGPLAVASLRDLDVGALPDGSGYRLQAVLADPLGTRTSRSDPVAIDHSPPRLLGLEPADGAVLTQSPASLRSTWVDVTSGVDDAEGTLTLGDVPLSVQRIGGQVRATPTATLADGPYSATAVVRDHAGNEARRTWSFTVDAAPPVIASAAIAATGANYVQVAWRTNEPAQCTASATGTPSLDEAPGSGLVTTHNAWITPLPPAQAVTVRILCRDRGGNPSALAQVDGRTQAAAGPAPLLEVHLDQPAELHDGWSPGAVHANASIEGSGQLFGSIDGGEFAPATDPWPAPEGSHVLRLVALGPGGASAVWKATVQVDTRPPTAPVPSLPAASGPVLEVAWTGAEDDGAPVPTVRLEARPAGAWIRQADLDGTLREGAARALPGAVAYRLVAVDRAGHEAASPEVTVTAATDLPAAASAHLRSPARMRVGLPLEVDVQGPPDAEPTARLLQGGREVARVPHADRVGAGQWLFTIGTGGLAAGDLVVQILLPDQAPQTLHIELLPGADAATETVQVHVKDSPALGPAAAVAMLVALAAWARRPRVPQ